MNVLIFLGFFFTVFLILRPLTHILDKERKGKRAKTPTAWLRRKTGKEIHHIHIGGIIVLIVTPFLIINGINKKEMFSLALGLSLVTDQLYFWLGKKLDNNTDYFSKRGFVYSLVSHIIIALLIIILYLIFK